MAKAHPRFAPESEKAFNKYLKDFEDDLLNVAKRIAKHAQAQTMDVVHVDSAFQALASIGLVNRRLTQRPELKFGIATALMTAALSCPDIASSWIDSETI